MRVQGPRAEPQFTVGVAGRRTRPGSAGRIHEAGRKDGGSDGTGGDVVDVRRPDDESSVECQQLGFMDRFRRTDAIQRRTAQIMTLKTWFHVQL